jgi:TNF receptor-associated protein 1
MEPFRNNKEIDILILTQQVDELLFQQLGEYKGKKFVSIESAFEELSKDLGKSVEQEASSRSRIPEDEITGFCLWLKNDL